MNFGQGVPRRRVTNLLSLSGMRGIDIMRNTIETLVSVLVDKK